jgi:hypothetical protein
MLSWEQHLVGRGEERLWSIADVIVRSAMPFTETAYLFSFFFSLLAALVGRLNM